MKVWNIFRGMGFEWSGIAFSVVFSVTQNLSFFFLPQCSGEMSKSYIAQNWAQTHLG